MRLRRAQNHRFSLYHLSHVLATHCFLRLTRARRQRFAMRTARVLLADFCRAFGHSKARYKKSISMFLRGRTMFAPTISKPEFHPKSKRKIHALSAFSFAYAGAKEKAIKKKTPISGFRALRSATRAACPCPRHLLKKVLENFIVFGENFNDG